VMPRQLRSGKGSREHAENGIRRQIRGAGAPCSFLFFGKKQIPISD
jgi:hypothetical protein